MYIRTSGETPNDIKYVVNAADVPAIKIKSRYSTSGTLTGDITAVMTEIQGGNGDAFITGRCEFIAVDVT